MSTEKRHAHKKTYYNDIALRLGERLLGLRHLHYGFFEPGEPTDLAALPAAQEAYVRHLLSFVPAGARRVLDVGCGTGGVARALVDRGHEVTCLAPDPYLIRKTLEATGGRVATRTDLYENVSDLPERSFDLVLMAESCQYVGVREGWRQHRRFLRPGGLVLVSDFFKRRDERLAHISKSGHVLDTYLKEAEAHGFRLARREDITERVAPTMDIYQALLSDKVFPVGEAIGEVVSRRYPRLAKLLRWRFGNKISALREKYSRQSSAVFREHKAYWILLFEDASLGGNA